MGPRPGYVDDFFVKNLLHEQRMKAVVMDDLSNLDEERFMKSWNFLKKNHRDKYKFLFSGGESLMKACYKICQRIWETERYPEEWNLATHIRLDKGKPDATSLENKRYIHIRVSVSKLFTHIVVSSANEELTRNMTKFQIGSKVGHRPEEHVFVITSFMAMLEKSKNACLFQLMDYSKFYDRESLRDVLLEVYRRKIKRKIYRLFLKMNESNVIQVMTPVGLTEKAETNEGFGQGNLDSPILSSAGLDSGAEIVFKDSRDEACYASLVLGPMLYVDDLFRIAPSVGSAHAGLKKMEQLAESKGLDYNLTKTSYIVIGNKKEKENRS